MKAMPKRKGKKDEFQVKVELRGEMVKRFNAIKREWGLESKSEVIRKIIEQKYQDIFGTTELEDL